MSCFSVRENAHKRLNMSKEHGISYTHQSTKHVIDVAYLPFTISLAGKLNIDPSSHDCPKRLRNTPKRRKCKQAAACKLT